MCALWCGAYIGCLCAGPTGGFGATRSGQRMSVQGRKQSSISPSRNHLSRSDWWQILFSVAPKFASGVECRRPDVATLYAAIAPRQLTAALRLPHQHLRHHRHRQHLGLLATQAGQTDRADPAARQSGWRNATVGKTVFETRALGGASDQAEAAPRPCNQSADQLRPQGVSERATAKAAWPALVRHCARSLDRTVARQDPCAALCQSGPATRRTTALVSFSGSIKSPFTARTSVHPRW